MPSFVGRGFAMRSSWTFVNIFMFLCPRFRAGLCDARAIPDVGHLHRVSMSSVSGWAFVTVVCGSIRRRSVAFLRSISDKDGKPLTYPRCSLLSSSFNALGVGRVFLWLRGSVRGLRKRLSCKRRGESGRGGDTMDLSRCEVVADLRGSNFQG